MRLMLIELYNKMAYVLITTKYMEVLRSRRANHTVIEIDIALP